MTRKHTIAAIIGAVMLVLLTAGASALITREMISEDKTPLETSAKVSSYRPHKRETITWNEQRQAPPHQQVATRNCDDGNVVGKVLGGVGGGVLGSQVGSGTGQTAATIGGTLGGAYLGGEYIPTDNVTCR
jgi:uncharacterized protein YcfJ